MFEPRRQHPVAAITTALNTLKEFFIPFIVIVVLGSRTEEAMMIYLLGAVVLILSLLGGGILSWMRYTYRVENDELKIEYGVFVRKRHFVPKDRIQVIDISAGLLQRLFGLVSVRVQTAGESSPEATISAVTRDEAEYLRTLLRKDTTQAETDETDTVIGELRLRKKDLLIAASTAGSFGIALSVIGTLTSQLNQIVSDTLVFEFIEGLDIPGAGMVMIIVAAVILLAWLLSLFGTIVQYSGFTLSKKKNELVIHRGLFERKQITIPYHRIQAVRIVEGILRQPFGYAAVYVDSAGYGEESGSSTVLFPLIKRNRLPDFFEDYLRDYKSGIPAAVPPSRALRRYIIQANLPVLIMVATLIMLFSHGYFALLLIPFGIWLGIQRYRDAAVGYNNRMLIMRFRNLAKTTAIIKRNCIQSAGLQSIYFQRRRDLLDFMVTVASGRGGATFVVKNLDTGDGSLCLNWVSGENADTQILPSSPGSVPGWL